MSTDSNGEGLSERKARHLEICTRKDLYDVEGDLRWWDELQFYHRALPELDAGQLDLSREFLTRRIRLPFFISCMTGGSEQGYQVNKNLARGAQSLGIPVGLGSHRILFRDPGVFDHFHLRKIAPDVPILSNIGGVQVRDLPSQALVEMNRRLEVDAQVIHLNPGQELFQEDGDRDFRGVKEAIARFIGISPIPVIVKETGFGLHPLEAKFFLNAGAAYVDLGGAGGTNWLTVEAYRSEAIIQEAAEAFRTWGHPTPVLLGVLRVLAPRILASGGVRDGVQAAKSLALGAWCVGMALPFVRAVVEEGTEGVLRRAALLRKQLETVMVLTGSPDLAALAQQELWVSPAYERRVGSYLKSRPVEFP